jgi:hypothetical protein
MALGVSDPKTLVLGMLREGYEEKTARGALPVYPS